MRWLLPLLAACSGGDRGPTTVVIAMAGDEFAAGATVLSHDANGGSIDRQSADAQGRAELVTDDGALVSVIFPAQIEPSTQAISIVTTPALASGELVVVGPVAPSVPAVAGALSITAPSIVADHFEVELGCATITVPTLPATVDVSAACLGSDVNLDVLVIAYMLDGEDLTSVAGYAATRVTLDAGVAAFDIPSWSTAGALIPLSTVAPVRAFAEISDGFAYPARTASANVELWDGLAVDATSVQAGLGATTLGQTTTRYQPGVPATIAFGSDDFLPQIEPTVLLDDRAALSIRWSAIATGAAVALHVAWTPGPQITWDAILALDAPGATFPALDADLAAQIQLPSSPTVDITSDLRAVDSTDIASFAALQAAGMHYDTAVPVPANGQIRATNASGFN